MACIQEGFVFVFDQFDICEGCVSEAWHRNFEEVMGNNFFTMLEEGELSEGTFTKDEKEISVKITDTEIWVTFNFNPEICPSLEIDADMEDDEELILDEDDEDVNFIY